MAEAMKQDNEDIYGDGGLVKLYDHPKPNWEICFGEDWYALTISQYWKSPPNWFQRLMAKWILGIHWRKV